MVLSICLFVFHYTWLNQYIFWCKQSITRPPSTSFHKVFSRPTPGQLRQRDMHYHLFHTFYHLQYMRQNISHMSSCLGDPTLLSPPGATPTAHMIHRRRRALRCGWEGRERGRRPSPRQPGCFRRAMRRSPLAFHIRIFSAMDGGQLRPRPSHCTTNEQEIDANAHHVIMPTSPLLGRQGQPKAAFHYWLLTERHPRTKAPCH